MIAAVLGGGCNGDRGPQRVIVSGKVTYQGKPVEDGMIRFLPAAGASVPAAGAYIVGGKYTADSQGGVPVGSYTVQIEGFRVPSVESGTPGSQGRSAMAGRGIQYLPSKHNSDSQMQIAVEPGGRAICKDFVLTD